MTELFKGVAARTPAQDLVRARRWYAEVLGLEPIEERPDGLRYRTDDGEFSVSASSGRSPGAFTQLAIAVDDIRLAANHLRVRRAQLLAYDAPTLVTVDGVARVEGNSPSKGVAELGCWFVDSENNMIRLGQSLR